MAKTSQESQAEREQRETMEAYAAFLEEAEREPIKYFKHDTNAHDDDALYRLVNEHGMAYYGWYWLLVELLTHRKDHSYQVRTRVTGGDKSSPPTLRDDPVGWRRLAMDMSCMCDMGVEECKAFVYTLDAHGLIDHDLLAELGQVAIMRIRMDARTYAEGAAKKKLGAWKTNRKNLFK